MNSLILDGLIVILLFVAIGSFFVLNRRISTLRRAQTELGSLIGRLTTATNQAQTSVLALKAASKETTDELHTSIARAKSLSEELAIITEAGDNLATRLEKQFSERPGKQTGRVIPLKKLMAEADPEILSAIQGAR